MQALFFIFILSIANIFCMNQSLIIAMQQLENARNSNIILYPHQALLSSIPNNTSANTQISNLLVPTPPAGLAPWEVNSMNAAFNIMLELLRMAKRPGNLYVKNFTEIKEIQDNLIEKLKIKNTDLNIDLVKKYIDILNKDFEIIFNEYNNLIKKIHEKKENIYDRNDLNNFWIEQRKKLCSIAKAEYGNFKNQFKNLDYARNNLKNLSKKDLLKLKLKAHELNFINFIILKIIVCIFFPKMPLEAELLSHGILDSSILLVWMTFYRWLWRGGSLENTYDIRSLKYYINNILIKNGINKNQDSNDIFDISSLFDEEKSSIEEII